MSTPVTQNQIDALDIRKALKVSLTDVETSLPKHIEAALADVKKESGYGSASNACDATATASTIMESIYTGIERDVKKAIADLHLSIATTKNGDTEDKAHAIADRLTSAVEQSLAANTALAMVEHLGLKAVSTRSDAGWGVGNGAAVVLQSKSNKLLVVDDIKQLMNTESKITNVYLTTTSGASDVSMIKNEGKDQCEQMRPVFGFNGPELGPIVVFNISHNTHINKGIAQAVVNASRKHSPLVRKRAGFLDDTLEQTAPVAIAVGYLLLEALPFIILL